MEDRSTPPSEPGSDVSRRTFLGLLAVTGAALSGCSLPGKAAVTPPTTPLPPTTTASTVTQTPSTNTVVPVVDTRETLECDVCVVGGGAAGMAAATAAANAGARTVLVEESCVLGGNITRGLVNIDRVAPHGNSLMVKGYFLSLLTRMISDGRAIAPDAANLHAIIYDTDYLGHLALYLARKAGAQALLSASLTSASVADRRITSIEVMQAGQRTAIQSDVYIDCTGDGNLGFVAGCNFWQGDAAYHQIQGQTLMFHVGGVDFPALLEYEKTKEPPSRTNLATDHQMVGLKEFMRRFRSKHPNLGRPQRGILMTRTHTPTVFCLSASEIYGNHLDGPEALASILASLREQDFAIHQTLRREVPAFRDSYIVRMAERPYLREGRRIQGLYQLTAGDVQRAAKFPDGVARGWYPIDLHTSYTGGAVQMRGPGYGAWYDIPYRCLVSRDLDNVLMAGRCISVTHEALGSTRVSALSMALGQAAGVAAAQAAGSRTLPADLPVAALRKELLTQGAPPL